METTNKTGIDYFIFKNEIHDKHLFKLIREIIFISQPLIVEKIKMGITVYVYGKRVICALINQTDHFQLKFACGKLLKDKRNILKGNHKLHKHIKVYNRDDIDPFVIYDFIKQSTGNNFQAC